ncbi:hypothetical protein HID58_081902, partial [Brassica napus]
MRSLVFATSHRIWAISEKVGGGDDDGVRSSIEEEGTCLRLGIYAHIHSIVLRRIVRDCTYLAPDKNGGVILIFKGIIESIPEVYALLNVMRVLGLLVHGVVAVKVSTLLLPYYFSIPSQLSQ